MKSGIIKNSFVVREVVLLFIILLTTFSIVQISSCKTNFKNEWISEEQQRLNREVDSVFSILDYYYAHNIDSAIIIANKVDRDFTKTKNYRSLVRLYSFLSEVYQYRIRDDVKALTYILEAMDIMANNPELKFDKTYLYINIGNILYHYELYDEAIYIYREVPEISESKITPEVNTLIYSNIALSFQTSERYDSAEYYFLKAEKEIENTGKGRLLLKIQNLNYRAALDMQRGNLELLPEYYNQTLHLFNMLDKALSISDNDVVEKYKEHIRIDYFNYKIRSMILISDYYLKENHEVSLKFLYEAVNYAKQINDKYLLSEIYFKISDIFFITKDKLYESDLFLDSILYGVNNNKFDYELLNKLYKQKSEIAEELGEFDDADYYRLMSDKYIDSLDLEKSSLDLIHGRIELAFRPVQLAITNVKLSRNEKNRIIYNQKILIYSLLCLLTIIILSIIIYYRLNLKLKKTRQDLALRTIENLKADSNSIIEKNGMKDKVAIQLLKKFEEEIIFPKVYLKSDINLNKVAEVLQTNRSYMSKIINTAFEKNFSDYINELRIKESCEIICKNTKHNFTIDHLYSEVGFTSKSTFYTAFKKYTGVTPAVFFKLKNSVNAKNGSKF